MKYLLFIVGMWEILKEQHSKRKDDKDVITDIYDADAMLQIHLFISQKMQEYCFVLMVFLCLNLQVCNIDM